jgi:hypothetical protein
MGRRSTCVRRCLDQTEPAVRVRPPLQTGVKGSHRLGKSISLDNQKQQTAEAFDLAQRWSAKDACCSTCEG